MNSIYPLRRSLLIGFLGFSVVLASCGKKDEDSKATIAPSDLSETANAASEQAVAVAQNFDSAAYAMIRSQRKTSVAKEMQNLVLPRAVAATACNAGGSSAGSCTSSGGSYVIQRTYNNCSMADSALTLSGTVNYTYSAAGCSMIGTTNRSVTRTTSLTMSGKNGGTLTISSANATDYRGNAIGGGQTLTVAGTSGQYTYSVGGVNRTLTGPAGTTLMSLSTRTTTALTASGTSLSNLVLSGGSLEIIHNRARYVLTLTANNVGFSNSCACPTSGSMTGTYSGSLSGSATITYTGCGTASVTTSGGSSADVTIDSCAY